MVITEELLTDFFEKLQQAVNEGYKIDEIGITKTNTHFRAELSPVKPVKEKIIVVRRKVGRPPNLPAPKWTRSPHLVPKDVAMSPARSYAYYYENRKGDFFPVIWYPKRKRRRHYIRRMYTSAEHGGMWYEKTGHTMKTGKFDMKEYGITWRLWADWPDNKERKAAEWPPLPEEVPSDNPTLVEDTLNT